MTILVQDIHCVRGRANGEFCGCCRGADTRWHMETIADVPVCLDLRVGDPELLHIVFGGLHVFALGIDHFCPTTVDCGWLALRI